jgi:uncharacterized protein (DUF2336 family)
MSVTSFNGLEVSVFTKVIDDGDAKSRIALALQLAKLIAEDETPDIEREQVTPVILRLTVDPAKTVREALADALADQSNLHADVAFSIIADDDDIALPFLATTQALNDWQMMAVLKVGDEPRQMVIASRNDLSGEAANHIVAHGPLGVVLALMDNAIVVFDDNDMRALYGRFGQVEEITERLLARQDLPLDIRITQAKRVAARMRQHMAEKSWIASNDVSEIVSDAEDSAVMQVLIEADDGERAKAVAFLATKNMLTPALLVRAASKGQMQVVEAGFAHLAGQPLARVIEQMYADRKASLKSLLRKAGLPQSCHGLMKAACDVYAEARDEGYPLREDEFGQRVLEALMTRYEQLDQNERAKQIEFIGRYGEERVRKIAKRLKADMLRAA